MKSFNSSIKNFLNLVSLEISKQLYPKDLIFFDVEPVRYNTNFIFFKRLHKNFKLLLSYTDISAKLFIFLRETNLFFPNYFLLYL